MIWVHNNEGNVGQYNTKKSAFWRVVKKVSLGNNPVEWYSNIAWSNLCKLAPFKGGNPSNSFYNQQLENCQRILSIEIEVLSPKFVVMLTSGWEKDFLFYLNDGVFPVEDMTILWNGYKTILYKIKNVNFIVSPHPQGKNEQNHIDAIHELISIASK
jgi:uracil-DNA glycosylase